MITKEYFLVAFLCDTMTAISEIKNPITSDNKWKLSLNNASEPEMRPPINSIKKNPQNTIIHNNKR